MAIEKNSFKGSRFNHEFYPNSRETTSSDEEEVQRRVSVAESDDDDDDDEFDDADSGAGFDDFDLLELGETGAEVCRIGNLTCGLPFELYDLSGLEDILSVDVWNEVLTAEDRFILTEYLPDLDQDYFTTTLKELLEGQSFHFGSPVKKLFEMLKGGLCEPRVALYREGLNFFQKRKHYHQLRNYQNNMVGNLCQMRDAWLNCRGYGIEEKLRVLNIVKSEKNLMYEKMEEGLASASSGKEYLGDAHWTKKAKGQKSAVKVGRNSAYGVGANSEFPSRVPPSIGLEVAKYGKQNPKGILKLAGSKSLASKEPTGGIPSGHQGLDTISRPYGIPLPISRQKAIAYDSSAAFRLRDQMGIYDYDDDEDDDGDDPEDGIYGGGIQRNVAHVSLMDKSGVLKARKKHDILRSEELSSDFMGFPFSLKNDVNTFGRIRNANQLSEVKLATTKLSNLRTSQELGKKTKYSENVHQFAVGAQMKPLKGRINLKGNQNNLSEYGESIWQGKNQGHAFPMESYLKSDDWNMRRKKWKAGSESPDLNVNDKILLSELISKPSLEKIRGNFVQNGGPDKRMKKINRMYARNEETESDSSEQFDEEEDGNPLMRSRLVYPGIVMDDTRSMLLKSSLDTKKGKLVKKDMLENAQPFDGMAEISNKFSGLGGHMPVYLSKGKQKGKMRDSSPLNSSCTRVLDNSSPFGFAKVKDDDDQKRSKKLGTNGHLRESGESLHISSLKAHPF